MAKSDFDTTPKKPEIEINKPPDSKPGGSYWQRPGSVLWVYLLFIIISLYMWEGAEQTRSAEIPYSEFLQYVDKGKIKEAVVTQKLITGTLTDTDPATNKPRRFYTIPLWDEDLAKLLEQKGVKFTVRHTNNWLSDFFFSWVLPFGFLFLLWGWFAKRMSGASKGFLNLGNRIHIHPEGDVKVTFDDVAGQEEAKTELDETIKFLRDPSTIQRLGGHAPKGVLLVGPPGTGKTLLARAVAGEAKVPFFNISGSEFIEMFVGMGAARVRELFEQARQKAPCIIFIDELDAIGGARGVAPIATGGHDEREQTLNQLLTEMDGFDPSVGVVVMAATNRPEILDKALLRAGRFDRQIVVDKPDLEARVAILELHTKNMTLADDVDLHVVAQRTPGFVGADLANIANEAAILAVRYEHKAITMADFEAAIDRVIAGPEKKNRGLNADEKRRVAFHESGHTLVAVTVPTGEPVHKVSIIPRGVAALGYTLQLPVDEKFLSTKNELRDQIAILLGGRVSEEIIFGDVSSGASNDLERASEIARSMVTQLGMSDKLGPLTWGHRQQLQFLGQSTEERNYSEETARLIDTEVKALVEEGRERAMKILTEKRAVLDALAARLEEREVMTGEEVEALIGEVQSSSTASA
ncbi:MAG TPA: ATP-dependent metallopeptidase FtsH/Yme1/Tma family protein [Gammaproteobacteria bacterium]|nr:ATP-dependent metallopeptidase FtsH/Yme1/Tma family protein [Gammaproteobacteria bacterium]